MENNNIRDCISVIRGQCSKDRLEENVKTISSFHRIQASQGYRDAATAALQVLNKNGITAKIQSYRADLKTQCYTQKLFREWNCTEAWLDITSPYSERIADFQKQEMSLIQRSAPWQHKDKEIEIVWIDDKCSPEDFQVSIKDKVIFVENGFERWLEKAATESAAGIITVSIPEIYPVRVDIAKDEQMAAAHGNLSFHHYTQKTESELRGFAITPRAAQKLKKACKELAKTGKAPTVKFYIASKFSDGTLENVEMFIPGQTEQEILMTAHLCHPRCSVNDNASGAACAMEAMNILQQLISDKLLPPPKRGIRGLLIPEFTGTYAYLSENEERAKNTLAGINMDMVGGKQDGNAGAFIIVDTPDAAKSFSGDLAQIILQELSRECNFGGSDIFVPLFLGLRVPFVFGSDHYILSDPTVDIPTVALTQWPDKTYHTSVDDAQHLDMNMLKRTTVLAAAYCYICASLTVENVLEILPTTASRFFERFNKLRSGCCDSAEKARQGEYLKTVMFGTLDRFETFFDGKEKRQVQQAVEAEKEYYRSLLQLTVAKGQKKPVPPSGKIPQRSFKAPIANRSVEAAYTAEQRDAHNTLCSKYPDCKGLCDYLVYEADGKKNIEQIAENVYMQTGKHCEDFAAEYFEFLGTLGLITFNGTDK